MRAEISIWLRYTVWHRGEVDRVRYRKESDRRAGRSKNGSYYHVDSLLCSLDDVGMYVFLVLRFFGCVLHGFGRLPSKSEILIAGSDDSLRMIAKQLDRIVCRWGKEAWETKTREFGENGFLWSSCSPNDWLKPNLIITLVLFGTNKFACAIHSKSPKWVVVVCIPPNDF